MTSRTWNGIGIVLLVVLFLAHVAYFAALVPAPTHNPDYRMEGRE